jgi:multidrug resistance efflux pump
VPIVLIAVVVALLVASRLVPTENKVSGYIESDEIRLGSRVGGRIAEVLVNEGQTVSKGQVLVRLGPYDLQERRSEAVAQVAVKQADLDRLKSGLRTEEVAQAKARVDQLKATVDKLVAGPRVEEIAAARSRLTLAGAQLARASQTYNRATALNAREPGTISQDELDRVTEDLKVAEANNRVREEELQLQERGTRVEDISVAKAQLDEAQQAFSMASKGYRVEEIAEGEAALTAARAAVDAIDVQIHELEIKSTVHGVMEALELRPGDLVAPNAPIMSVLDTGRMWVRAYLPENRMKLQIGDQVPVTVDSYPGKTFTGIVTYISSQAEFTPRNVQTPEERSKQVFRIKVELKNDEHLLLTGMAADVWIDKKISTSSKP